MAMEEGRREYLVGLFYDRQAAEEAYEDLKEAGYARDEINVIMSNETRHKYYPADQDKGERSEMGNNAVEGMGIPGLGLVIVGPIAGAIAGIGAGGLTGGIVGALIGSGISEERAEHINRELNQGKILLSVRPRNFDDVVRFTRKWEKQENAEVYV